MQRHGPVGREGKASVRPYLKWIVLGLILAFVVAIEVYKGGEKLPWALVFVAVVVFFVYSVWRRR